MCKKLDYSYNNTLSYHNLEFMSFFNFSYYYQLDTQISCSFTFTVAQDGHLQRVTIPEAAYVQFASLTS